MRNSLSKYDLRKVSRQIGHPLSVMAFQIAGNAAVLSTGYSN